MSACSLLPFVPVAIGRVEVFGDRRGEKWAEREGARPGRAGSCKPGVSELRSVLPVTNRAGMQPARA